MARVPGVLREELSPEDQPLFDELAAKRVVVDGVIQGPFGVMLRSPEATKRTAEVGNYYRYEQPLPARLRHLVGLVVARHMDCQYEYTVHAELGRKEGLPRQAVDDLGHEREPTGLTPDDMTVYRFVRQLVKENRVDGPAFDGMTRLLGPQGVTDVVGTAGYLMMLAAIMNAYEVEVRPEQIPEMPPRGELN